AFAHAIVERVGLLQVEHFPWVRMPTMYVAVLHATNEPSLATGAQIAMTTIVVTACVWVWRRTDDLVARSLALAASFPLVGPYAYDYDASALIVPIVCLAWEAYRRKHISTADVLLLAWIWLTPRAIWVVSRTVGQQVGPMLLVPVLAAAVARTFRRVSARSMIRA